MWTGYWVLVAVAVLGLALIVRQVWRYYINLRNIAQEGRGLYDRLRLPWGKNAVDRDYKRFVAYLERYPWLEKKRWGGLTTSLANQARQENYKRRAKELVDLLEHGGTTPAKAEGFLDELEGLEAAGVDLVELRKQYLAVYVAAKSREKEAEFSGLWREVTELAKWQDRHLTPEQTEPFRKLKARLDQALPTLEEAAAQAGLIHQPSV